MKQLRPIFRDRHDFDAGGTLGEQTVAALDDAGALIILASPASASSKPVDAEVRLFQSRHPDRPLIPLILDGEPGSNERECLPQALRATGEVLAADLRDSGDGRELALAKVVARLLGLAPDEYSAVLSACAAARLVSATQSSACSPCSPSPPPAARSTPGTS
jgi:hypothetical protein